MTDLIFIFLLELEFLGMPCFIANGIHERPGSKYRFLVMQRFGDDLQKKLNENNNTFDLKTAYTLASKGDYGPNLVILILCNPMFASFITTVIDILEYIHSFGYIHADIKASNLLLGRSRAPTPKVRVSDLSLVSWLLESNFVLHSII